jgi:hypothetical protein
MLSSLTTKSCYKHKCAGRACRLVIQRLEFVHGEEDNVADHRSNNENLIRTGIIEDTRCFDIESLHDDLQDR